MADEFGPGRGEDVVPLREDATAGGRGDHAALGHHQGDRGAQSERLAALPPYGLTGTPLRPLLAVAAVLLRLLAGGDRCLACKVDALGSVVMRSPPRPCRHRAVGRRARATGPSAARPRPSREAALPAPRPLTTPDPAPALADAGLPARADRVRATLAAAGVDFEKLGAAPEPVWFAALRNGQHVPLGTAELKETSNHLAGIAPEAVLTEDACTRSSLRDLQDEGLDLRFCHGELPEDAAYLRTLADYVRDEMAAAAEGDDETPTSPGHAA